MLPLVHDVSIGCCHWFLTRPRRTYFTLADSVPSGSITIYYNAILSYHLQLGHPNDLFPSGSPTEPCTHFPWVPPCPRLFPLPLTYRRAHCRHTKHASAVSVAQVHSARVWTSLHRAAPLIFKYRVAVWRPQHGAFNYLASHLNSKMSPPATTANPLCQCFKIQIFWKNTNKKRNWVLQGMTH